MRGVRGRHWCFTDFTLSEFSADLPAGVTYVCYQKEKCETTGRLHHQGYIELAQTRMRKWIQKNAFNSAQVHLEVRRGTSVQAVDYCKKTKTYVAGPWEHGTKSKGAGRKRKSDFEVKEYVKSGGTFLETIENQPEIIAKRAKYFNTLLEVFGARPREQPEVILCIGDTGTGKSTYAFQRRDNPLGLNFWVSNISNGTLWFDRYHGQEIAVLEEFCGSKSKWPLDTLLRVLDKFPVSVPVKNGHVNWCPKTIIITTNIEPQNWYSWTGRERNRDALKRRITKIIEFIHINDDYQQNDVTDIWDWDDMDPNTQKLPYNINDK